MGWIKRWGWLFGLGWVLTGSASAELVKETVEYRDGSAVLEGYLVRDSRWEGPRPVVLIVHDWNGLDDYERMRAEMIADAGYVALAVDVYGKGVRPSTVADCAREAGKWYADRTAWRKRLGAAVTYAKTRKEVQKDAIAAIGYCFGGAAVLEMARAGMDLKGVASFHGGLKTTMPAVKGAVKASVLVLHGEADPMVPPTEVKAFEAEMKSAGATYRVVSYAGAVHSFTVPNSEKAGVPGVAYQKEADEQSWDELLKFLKGLF